MCGIVGAISKRNIVPLLVEGLYRLEYRGYDSCGIAVYQSGALKRARSVARVRDLEAQLGMESLAANIGIAHTRWASHGKPTTENAHPHFSPNTEQSRFAMVHNGIIENYEEIRTKLEHAGFTFSSETDSEAIVHLISHLYNGDLFATVRQTVGLLKGAYGIAVLCRDEPLRVVGARFGSPLVVGMSDGTHGPEIFLASDAVALSGVADHIVYLEDGDVVDIRLDGYIIIDKEGEPVQREIRAAPMHATAVDLGPYCHFMQKEIFEQPRVVADTLEGIDNIGTHLFASTAGHSPEALLRDIDTVVILACGTSYHAGSIARYWLESIAGIPTAVEVASEYRYRESVPNPRTLVVAISQSGETADTLGALKYAQSMGMNKTLSICNASTSSLVRQTALHFLTRAGMEIGVASTKAFTTQLVGLFLLALTIAKQRGRLSSTQEAVFHKELRHLPTALQAVLALEPQVIAWAGEFASKEHALFLGRGLHYPIALEGALKMKEVSYIHAEGYPAGELKHGPLALVTAQVPVVTVAPNDKLLEKLKSNMQEVRARGGQLFVFADSDTNIRSDQGFHVIRMPEHYGKLSPILHVVPLQLLAYHTACARGTDVDKPRNLAKSVTVE